MIIRDDRQCWMCRCDEVVAASSDLIQFRLVHSIHPERNELIVATISRAASLPRSPRSVDGVASYVGGVSASSEEQQQLSTKRNCSRARGCGRGRGRGRVRGRSFVDETRDAVAL